MTTTSFSLDVEESLKRVLTSYVEVIEGLRGSKNYAADAVTLKFFWLIITLQNDGVDVQWAIDRLKEKI